MRNILLINTGKEEVWYRKVEKELREKEKQISQLKKMEAISRLAGGVAHDFNNILTIIDGFNSVILAELDPNNSLYHDAFEIARAVERATTLVQQLLIFSRKKRSQPILVDLNDSD